MLSRVAIEASFGSAKAPRLESCPGCFRFRSTFLKTVSPMVSRNGSSCSAKILYHSGIRRIGSV